MQVKLLPNIMIITSLLGVSVLVKKYFSPATQEIIGFVHVIDGDSLRVDGQEIRIWGIDAPEFMQTCQQNGQEIKCGRDAARHMAGLISGQPAKCTVRDMDKYHRHVSTCIVEGVDIARAMVLSGYAVSYGGYLTEEAEARTSSRGIWAMQFERPQDYRKRMRESKGQ